MTFIAPQVDTYPYFGSGDGEYVVRNLFTNFGQKTVTPRAPLPLHAEPEKDLHLGSIPRRNSRESETRFAVRKETELRTFRADGRDVRLSPA
jgi:hypothetical protein